ncbi:hypothetical protein K2X33_09720 [bacterium]|nr:hypothetical protein [bacterium]
MKITPVLTLLLLGTFALDSEAGWRQRRQRQQQECEETCSVPQATDTRPYVSIYPYGYRYPGMSYEGERKYQDGWLMQFYYYEPNYGKWRGICPENENPNDYQNGYPKHGLQRYYKGYLFSYDAYAGQWRAVK